MLCNLVTLLPWTMFGTKKGHLQLKLSKSEKEQWSDF